MWLFVSNHLPYVHLLVSTSNTVFCSRIKLSFSEYGFWPNLKHSTMLWLDMLQNRQDALFVCLFVLFQQINDYKKKQYKGEVLRPTAQWHYSQSRRQALFVSRQLKVQKKKHFYNESSRCALTACLKPSSKYGILTGSLTSL